MDESGGVASRSSESVCSNYKPFENCMNFQAIYTRSELPSVSILKYLCMYIIRVSPPLARPVYSLQGKPHEM